MLINTGAGFTLSEEFSASLQSLSFLRPAPNVAKGIRVLDVNNDGLADILQRYFMATNQGPIITQGVYINTGNGWEKDDRYFIPTDLGASLMQDGEQEYDVRFVDFNGDSLLDIKPPPPLATYLASPKY